MKFVSHIFCLMSSADMMYSWSTSQVSSETPGTFILTQHEQRHALLWTSHYFLQHHPEQEEEFPLKDEAKHVSRIEDLLFICSCADRCLLPTPAFDRLAD